jgi:UPF0755 protein
MRSSATEGGLVARLTGSHVLGGLFRVLLALVLVCLVAAGGAWVYGTHVFSRPGPETADGQPRGVVIERGASVTAIAAALEDAGAIRSASEFRLALRTLDQVGPGAGGLPADKPLTLKAGEYLIPSGASLREVVRQLEGGEVMLYTVVAPEGLTSAAVMSLLAAENWPSNRDGGRTYRLPSDSEETLPPEGSLLPGDYMVQRGDTRADVVARMVSAQRQVIEELWPQRQQGLPFATQEQALILASIVEKETSVPSERPMVAAVFVNRLRKGMRLETDPTIIYGVCLRRPDTCRDGRLVNERGERRTIRQSEIDLDTGYNTYQIDGLPPTPISNPGRASIEAVLNPPTTNALFFVADGAGGHAFAATYAEHQRNVARWREIERERLSGGVP